MNSGQRKNIQSLITEMIEKKINFEIKVNYQDFEFVRVTIEDKNSYLCSLSSIKDFDSELAKIRTILRNLKNGKTDVFRKDVFEKLAELIANQPEGVYSCLTIQRDIASLFISTEDSLRPKISGVIESELIKYDDTAEASLQKIKVLYRICRDRLKKEVADDNE